MSEDDRVSRGSEPDDRSLRARPPRLLRPLFTEMSRATHPSVGYGGAFIWLLFILFPLATAIGRHETLLRHVLSGAGALLFVGVYIALILGWRSNRRDRVTGSLFGVLLLLATALTIGDASGWAFLFTYCAACSALVPPSPFGFWAVVTCTALAGGTSAVAGANGGSVVGYVASSAGIGLLMLLFRDLRIRNHELSEARAELARHAVALERERFARDLHDLLGHSLSVIALKAELARRLIPDRPAEAITEAAEVEQVARTALSEVREAVSGYRQPTLDGEIAGARMALSAAGIKAHVQRSATGLDTETEGMLAWVLREGATNVIRHSGASHCTVRVARSLTDATIEILDNGIGRAGSEPGGLRASSSSADSERGGGHGLEGLAERAASLHGRLEAGTRPGGGGFRLCVTLPVGA